MAEKNGSTSLEKLLVKFITEPDPLFSMLEWMTNEFMRLEATNKVGAEKGVHTPERKTHFSGTRVRRWDTRLGTIYLLIPKLRNGGYIPFFVTERKRSEQALINVVQEAFINGVSTRKMERLFKELGIENLAPTQVSEMTRDLDERVTQFQTRNLQYEYPIVWIDALYEKIRDNGRVQNMAVMVVNAVSMDGRREILAVEPMCQESEETYTILFNKLKARGLGKIHLCVSDAHAGLVAAISKSWLGCSWQRCKVHFMRNILAHVAAAGKAEFGARLKQIWLQPDRASAIKLAQIIIDEYQRKYPKAIETLENGLEDSLQFYHFKILDGRKISSTNQQERQNKEIRRRSKVVGIFPNINSYVRLITCYLIEYEEDWSVGKAYICPDTLREQMNLLEAA